MNDELQRESVENNSYFPVTSTVIYNNEHCPIFLLKNCDFKRINNDNVLMYCSDLSGNKTMEVAKYFNKKIKNNIIYCYDKRDYEYSHIHKLQPGFYMLNLKYQSIIDLNHYISKNTYFDYFSKITPYGCLIANKNKIFIYNFYEHKIPSILISHSNDYVIDKQQFDIKIENIFNKQ